MKVVRHDDMMARLQHFGPRLRAAQHAAALRAKGPHEGWWQVGAPSLPGFGSGWSNAPGLGAAPVGYFKDTDSLVWFRGVVRRSGSAWAQPVFTLPVGYRPSHPALIQQLSLSSAQGQPLYGGIRVLPDGRLLAPNEGADAASTRYISLSGFHFRAAG